MKILFCKWTRLAWVASVACCLAQPGVGAEYAKLQDTGATVSLSDQPAPAEASLSDLPAAARASIYDGAPAYTQGCLGGPSCPYPDACYGGGYCPPILTVRAEYLMWWTRGRQLPPLVTTSPEGTDRDEAGILGIDGTEILFGDEAIGEEMRSGGRVSLSYLCDPCAGTYLDVRLWAVENGNETFFAESDGEPILARPFFNVLLDREDAQLVAFPGVTTDGSILIDSDNDLWGGDAMLRCLCTSTCCGEVYLLGGYQFTALDDTLFIRNVQTSIDTESGIPPGTVIDVQDEFTAQNRFHAGSLGMQWLSYGCHCDWELLAKVALGNVRQRVVIDGRNIQTPPGGPSELNVGGLLAQPTNIGEFERSRFACIPELDLNVRYHVHCNCDLVFGYSIIYWSDVALAAEQIDRGDTLGPPVGVDRPQFAFNSSDFWAQGLNLGLECRW